MTATISAARDSMDFKTQWKSKDFNNFFSYGGAFLGYQGGSTIPFKMSKTVFKKKITRHLNSLN